jgi:hypothetical protein
MDANKWSMVEDLGSLLVPRADKSVGLENISRRLAAVERWIDRWLRFARYGLRFIGPLIAILAVWILSEWASAPTGFWPSRVAQSGLSVIVALAFAATICVIPIQAMQYAARVGLVPKVLRDPGLAPIKNYLKRCASGTISVFDKKGAKVDQSTFASPWAILLVSSHRRFRGIRLIGATRPYPDPLAVERPKGAQPRVPQVLQPTVNVLIDRRSTVVAIDQSVNIAVELQYLQFVSEFRRDMATMATSGRGGDNGLDAHGAAMVHWPCQFEQTDFDIRFRIFSETVLPKEPKVQGHQLKKYQIAVAYARVLWFKEPEQTIDDMSVELGKLIADKTGGWAGLRRQSTSTAWIRSVISGTGDYAFIKERMQAIEYDLAEYDGVQLEDYRLLF